MALACPCSSRGEQKHVVAHQPSTQHASGEPVDDRMEPRQAASGAIAHSGGSLPSAAVGLVQPTLLLTGRDTCDLDSTAESHWSAQ